MGKTFVYNAGEAKNPADKLELVFGLFFDGTLNNRRNTQIHHRVFGMDREIAATKQEKNIYKNHATERTWSTLWLIRKEEPDTSYTNDYSNVARMSLCCDETEYGIYIEGIGTKDKLSDEKNGYAFGSSETGIRGKVRKGCEKLAEKIITAKQKKGKKEITHITVDVFGFSRGAAAARNFIYEVNAKPQEKPIIKRVVNKGHYTRQLVGNKYSIEVPSYKEILIDADACEIPTDALKNGKLPKMGHLGLALFQQGMSLLEIENIEITIRFVGVYDTVSSHEEFGDMDIVKLLAKGAAHATLGPKNYFSDDVKKLQLNNLGRITKAVHFTAQDEHRENFALTRMPSANIEKSLPGVHCDIGGAYENVNENVDEIETSYHKPLWLLQNYKQQLIDEYWFKEKQIEINNKFLNFATSGGVYKKITGSRILKKEYSYLPLHFMEHACFELMKANIIPSKIPSTSYPIGEDKILKQAKIILHKYLFENGDPLLFISDEEIKKRKEENRKAAEKAIAKKAFEEDMEKIRRGHGAEVFGKNEIPIAQDNLKPFPKPVIEFKDPTLLPEVVVVGYTEQGIIRKLRNEYLHWSANREGLGMDPTNDYKRKIY